MKIKKLFKIPVSSLELSDKIEMKIEGLDTTIILKYFDEKNKVLKLRFNTVLCHMGTSKKFTKEMFDAYDTLVEIEDSEWLNELKEINEEEVDFWEVKHYAIFLEDSRMYQFIASGYDIIEEE